MTLPWVLPQKCSELGPAVSEEPWRDDSPSFWVLSVMVEPTYVSKVLLGAV